MEVAFKTAPQGVVPRRQSPLAIGYDLCNAEAVTFEPRQVRVVPTGLSLLAELPANVPGAMGYAGLDCRNIAHPPFGASLPPGTAIGLFVYARSSLLLKTGLMLGNSVGVVDPDYAGDVGLVLWNTRDEAVAVEAGTRLAQAVFHPVFLPHVREASVEEYVCAADYRLHARAGFGSTGGY
jgi:deoxyuridine 5'-triphosphate nucleotidohydrolase